MVIFSEGINKKHQELKGAKVVEKHDWKHKSQEQIGTRTAICIFKGYKKIIGEDPKIPLKIVNMPPLTGRKFPENLSIFATNKDFPRNIIFIPEIQAPASEETLKTLFNLREQHVCITGAKRESNEVPAAECIAVGVEHYTDKMITSGVLDFILDASECEECTSLDDGVATVVGMVAGFMQTFLVTFEGK